MKILTGQVVANKMSKTIVVEIKRRFTHPLYKKTLWRSSRIKAHTEEPVPVGATVILESTRPLSKEKHYQVKQVVVEKA